MSGQGETTIPSLAGWRFQSLLVATDFSEVWAAEDLALGRAMAVKIFSPKADERGIIPPFHVDEWRRRFIQEARLMARFDHPHIVPVSALATVDDGRPAMVMQRLWGSLRQEIGVDEFDEAEVAKKRDEDKPRAASPARTRQVLLELLSALMAIHDFGAVHRDVKPRNLLLAGGPGGRIKLTDFGMAKAPDERRDDAGLWFGTRDYISPEQFVNATHATDRSDIFSAGVVGVRMLTGRFPDRERLASTQGVPPALSRLLTDALAQDPAARPSAREMASRLWEIRL